MRIYLDQMLKVDLAVALQKVGHDVLRTEEVGQSRADDEEILHFTIAQDRVLVTLDEHFGDWAILPLNNHPGVIRVKVHPPTTESISTILLPLLSTRNHEDFRNKLVIVSTRNVRWIQTVL